MLKRISSDFKNPLTPKTKTTKRQNICKDGFLQNKKKRKKGRLSE
jgi:hypothetical protein